MAPLVPSSVSSTLPPPQRAAAGSPAPSAPSKLPLARPGRARGEACGQPATGPEGEAGGGGASHAGRCSAAPPPSLPRRIQVVAEDLEPGEVREGAGREAGAACGPRRRRRGRRASSRTGEATRHSGGRRAGAPSGASGEGRPSSRIRASPDFFLIYFFPDTPPICISDVSMAYPYRIRTFG